MRIEPGQVAFITGGASGIGLGLAQACGAAGLAVAIADIDPAALAIAEARLTGAGVKVLSLHLDVTSSQDWSQAVDATWNAFGRIDLLCNNAGIGQGRTKGGAGLIDLPQALWRLVLEVNATGAFLGVQAVVPRMIAAGRGGHIVNTASMAGLIAPAGLGAYAASKFAVMAMSESLRAELAPHGIGVSILCPGGVESNLNATTAARHAQALGQDPAPTRPPGVTLMTARAVAEFVLQGVAEDRMHLLPHPEYAPLVSERHRAVERAFGTSAQPGYLDPEGLLSASRNPAYLAATASET